MKKEDFKFECPEYYIKDAYVYEDENVLLVINKDIFDEETVEYATKIVEKYNKEYDQIFNYMLDNGVHDFYGDKYSDEEIKNKMGKPQIHIYSKKDESHPEWKFKFDGSIDFCHCKLDEHILIIEFIDDLELYGKVQFDG